MYFSTGKSTLMEAFGTRLRVGWAPLPIIRLMHCVRESVRVCVCVRERVCVFARVRVWEREKECECVHESERDIYILCTIKEE